MAVKFNALVARARATGSDNNRQPAKIESGSGSYLSQTYSPMKDIFEIVVRAAEIFGFEFLRVEPDDYIIVFNGADTIDKNLFMIAMANPKDMELKAGFAIGDIDELRPLLQEDMPMGISYTEVEVPVLPENDDEQEGRENTTRTELRPIDLVFNDGDVQHRLAGISCAPKASLKKAIEPTLSILVDLQTGFGEFSKHAKRLKSAERFGIVIVENSVKFRIGHYDGHHAFVKMGPCDDNADVGRHEFDTKLFLKIVKCATDIGSDAITCNVDKRSGLMQLKFEVITKYDETVAFQVILPGKLC